VRDTGGELTKRSEFLCLHQAVLCGTQIIQRFRKLACASLNTFEQPHVFDCNHRLVSERLDQFDLSVGERLNLATIEAERTNWLPLTQHRDTDKRSNAEDCLAGVGESVFRIGGDVCNVKHVALKDGPPYECPAIWRHRPDLTQGIDSDPVKIVVGYDINHLSVEGIYDTVPGSAQVDGIVGDRLEYGLNVRR
jgi:hypothetical protein